MDTPRIPISNISADSASTVSYWRIVIPYATILFFISLSDAIMSFISPVYINSHVSSPFVMGIIIASSSIVGIICDLIFSRIFKNKTSVFFLWLAILFAGLFPTILGFLPAHISVFILAMTSWGIYYELLQFSNFSFIRQSLPGKHFSAGWGIISSFKAAAYIIGPLIISYFVGSELDHRQAFIFALYIILFAALLYLIFSSKKTNMLHQAQKEIPSTTAIYPWFQEFKIWKSLISKTWPVFMFVLILYLIDSAFWTIGALFSEQLQESSHWGGLLLPAYSLPTLFTGLFIGRIFPSTGKKKLAFISAALAGFLLIISGFLLQPLLIILTVLVSSTLLSISFPEISAVFEDYVSRLDNFGNDMVGLESSAVSLAYIIGPIIAGLISTIVGNHLTFSIFGFVLMVYSLVALYVTPKKIRLPQQELQNNIS